MHVRATGDNYREKRCRPPSTSGLQRGFMAKPQSRSLHRSSPSTAPSPRRSGKSRAGESTMGHEAPCPWTDAPYVRLGDGNARPFSWRQMAQSSNLWIIGPNVSESLDGADAVKCKGDPLLCPLRFVRRRKRAEANGAASTALCTANLAPGQIWPESGSLTSMQCYASGKDGGVCQSVSRAQNGSSELKSQVSVRYLFMKAQDLTEP